MLYFLTTIALISICILFVNVFDTLNKFRSEIIPLRTIFSISIYNLPHIVSEIFPIIILISSLFLYDSLSKKNEIIIMLSGGVSIWKFMQPFILASLFLTIFAITILQPFSSVCIDQKNIIERKYNSKKNPVLSIANGGIYISEFIDNENRIINAKYILAEEKILHGVNLIILDENFVFKKRISSESAFMDNGHISFIGKSTSIGNDGEEINLETGSIKTKLDFNNIIKKFESPESVSFWKLDDIAKNLEDSGIKATKFVNYYYKLLFRPVYVMSVVIIGLCFLKVNPRGRRGYKILGIGSIVGIVIHGVSEVSTATLISNSFSPAMAQFIPSFCLICIGMIYLIQKYEG